jgi:sugar-specific transcriptional regulator TrmB
MNYSQGEERKEILSVSNNLSEESLIKDLEALGLTGNEAKIYFAMLGRPLFKAAEIAQVAKVPRPKVYEALNNLLSMGFCYAVPGAVSQYSAVPPAEALTNMQERKEQEQTRRFLKEREMVSDLVTRLIPLHEAGQSETGALRYIDVLTERGRIIQVANDLLMSATETILVFEKEPYAQDPRTLGTYEIEAARRGVEVRCIFEDNVRGLKDRIGPLREAGAEIKTSPALPMKLIVADERAAICALRDPITGQQSLTSLRIEHPDFAKAMRLLFDSIWQITPQYDLALPGSSFSRDEVKR